MKRSITLGSILILSLMVLSLGVQIDPAQAQLGGFFESFDDPEMPGWNKTPGAEIVDGMLFIGSENYVHRPGEWNNLELSMLVRHMTPGDFVISFRAAGSEGFHLLLGMESITLQREVNGEVQHLKNLEFPKIEVGEWFELTVVALDENITVGINQGEPLLAVSNIGSSIPGSLSIETFMGSEIQLDEISIKIPGEEVEQEEVDEESSQTNTEGTTIGDLPALPWMYTGGPSGGLGYDIRMDPRDKEIMYVTDAFAGAFKSTDGGKNWVPINTGITARMGPSGDGIPVFSLTIDQNNPDTIWVGTQFGGGVFRSDDAGNTWTSMSNGIQERSITIRGFSVEPGNSDTVYLAGEVSSWEWNNELINGILFDLTKGVVYKSTDRGLNWSRIWVGDHLARYVLIDPEDHNRLYVSTGIFDREAANSNPETLDIGGVGVVRSTDGGVSWEILGPENGFLEDELYVGSLAMHPGDSRILFAASGSDAHLTALNKLIGGIYRTTDGGDSWNRVLALPNASAVEICESNPNVVYAGSPSFFYRSDDGGSTWQLMNGSQEGRLDDFWGPENVVAGFPIDMQCDPDNAMRIYVNNYGGGNFLSDDGGITWESVSSGYTGAIMNKVVASANNPAVVYGTARSGIFKSVDGGVSWEGLATGKARGLEALGLAVNPRDEQHIIAVIADAPIPKISLDGGQTWHESDPLIKNGDQAEWVGLENISFSPTTPGVVIGIRGEKKCNEIPACENGLGALYSSDSGESWALSDLPRRVAMDLFFDQTGTAYVSLYPADIYRSDDGGKTWDLLARDVASRPNPNSTHADHVINALAIDPDDPSRIYVGFTLGGVSISTDSGITWQSSSAGMVPEASIFDLVVDNAHPGVVYAASYNSGIYRSMDDGLTWQVFNEGLTMRASSSLSLSADGSILYVATEGAGVFRLSPDGNPPLSVTSVADEIEEELEEQQAEETEPEQVAEDTGQDISPVIDENSQPEVKTFISWPVGLAILVLFGGIVGFYLVAKNRRKP